MNRKYHKILTILIISAFLTSVVPYLAKASTMPILSVKPASIINTALIPGTTFLINCSIESISDLSAWQITLHFDPSILNCTSAILPADHVFAGKSFLPLTPVIDNTAGSILDGATLLGAATTFNGNGILCQIQFKVMGFGHSSLTYSDPSTGDTLLLDSNSEPIPLIVQNGYFSNVVSPPGPVALFDYSPTPPLVGQTVTFNGSTSYARAPGGTITNYDWNFGDGGAGSGAIVTHTYAAAGVYLANLTVTDNNHLTNMTQQSIQVYSNIPARLFVNPPEIRDPTLHPPAIIVINVSVADVRNMYDYFFKLNFDPTLLTCIGIMINRVQGETHFTPIISIDDDIGLIKVNVTYYSPAIPITSSDPLDLVTITFQLNALGSSTLHLSETELSDPSGGMIPHTDQDGLIMVVVRDVAVTSVAPENSWVYAGWTTHIIVKVKNMGNITETFNVHALYNSNSIGTTTVTGLAPNTESTLGFTWDTTGIPEGNYTISANADPVPYEYNLTNNILVDGKVFILTHIHDVAITNVTANRVWVYQGWLVNVTVTAQNLGEFSETFDVNCSYDGNLIGTVNVASLAAASSITLTFKWNTATAPYCHNYTISGAASVVPYEFDTTNNIFNDGKVKVRIMGDVNGDGKVNILDVSATAQAFGSYLGDPSGRWNPDCDFNQDNKVNILDIVIVARNFGMAC